MPKYGLCGSDTVRCTGSEEAVITGTVNAGRQANIWLPARGPDERERKIGGALGLTLHPMTLLEVVEGGEEAR